MPHLKLATVVLPCLLAVGLSLASTAANVKSDATVKGIGFNKDIRPILADNCITCHGPDSAARRAGLRLDRRDGLVAKRILVPGNPSASILMQRINAHGVLQMPPASSQRVITREQKQMLATWIRSGANYEPHWAYQPIQLIKTPKGPGNPVDAFINAEITRRKLVPAGSATKREWLRRVSLDLTGLPPTQEDINAFVADSSKGAKETVVNRLLASPAFGEHTSVAWLDLARYGDSYGYQSDQLSPTWPYRDWVIRALNTNMPYDEFIVNQVAGDLRPDATVETKLGTTFQRLHRMTNEGGSVAEEWRMEGVADRVRTTTTAFLGLTFECARCHDHKFDPIKQRDYYALASFVNNVDEYGLYNQSDIVPTPSLLLPTNAQEAAIAGAKDRVATIEKTLSEHKGWSTGGKRIFSPGRPGLTARYRLDDRNGTSFPNSAPGYTEAASAPLGLASTNGVKGSAIQLNGDNALSLGGTGRIARHVPHTVGMWLFDERVDDEQMVVFHGSAGTDVGFHGGDVTIKAGRVTARMYRHWPGNAIAVETKQRIRAKEWTHLTVTYDGSSKAAGYRIYINGVQQETNVVRDHIWKGTGTHAINVGERFRERGFRGGKVDEIEVYNRALTATEVSWMSRGIPAEAPRMLDEVTPADQTAYASAHDEESLAIGKELQDARFAVAAAEDGVREVLAMEEMPGLRPTYVLARGAYDAPKTPDMLVNRQVPSFLQQLRASKPNRLDLAKWMVSNENPLTARVAVNRFWMQLFGRGIVETQEDFGVQGSRPTHPELLDWLAADFRTHDWDVKRLLKMLALSDAYGRTSNVPKQQRQLDPDNKYLTRGPSGRLSAEQIRDTALSIAGLLDRKMGGPPVSPYQPGDLWRETNSMSPAYRESVGTDLYRRSVYSVWKRTSPMVNMLAFDAATREVCTARRPSTSTPLQAFVLMNDVQFAEAARVFAENVLEVAGLDSDNQLRIKRMFLSATGREANAIEVKALSSLLDAQLRYFADRQEDAKLVAAVGKHSVNAKLQRHTVAAWTMVAQAVLNSDACVWKR